MTGPRTRANGADQFVVEVRRNKPDGSQKAWSAASRWERTHYEFREPRMQATDAEEVRRLEEDGRATNGRAAQQRAAEKGKPDPVPGDVP